MMALSTYLRVLLWLPSLSSSTLLLSLKWRLHRHLVLLQPLKRLWYLRLPNPSQLPHLLCQSSPPVESARKCRRRSGRHSSWNETYGLRTEDLCENEGLQQFRCSGKIPLNCRKSSLYHYHLCFLLYATSEIHYCRTVI